MVWRRSGCRGTEPGTVIGTIIERNEPGTVMLLDGAHVAIMGNGDTEPIAGNECGGHQVRPPKSAVAQRARCPAWASRSTAACHSWRPLRISARSARVSMCSPNRTLCPCSTAISACWYVVSISLAVFMTNQAIDSTVHNIRNDMEKSSCNLFNSILQP